MTNRNKKQMVSKKEVLYLLSNVVNHVYKWRHHIFTCRVHLIVI